jgi:hypothetical protein
MVKVSKTRRGIRRATRKVIIKKKSVKNPYRANANARILYQGVAATANKNFGTGKPSPGTALSLAKCLDARIPKTLGLPRAVGPYTVIRTNSYVTATQQSAFMMFTPLIKKMNDEKRWLPAVGLMQAGAMTDQVGAANGITLMANPLSDLGEAAEMVPAAMTVQCVNANSLQTARGTFFMGRVNQSFDYGASTNTWEDLRSRFISYFSPRMLAAGKLALRGVKCSSYPLNMSEYSDFLPRHTNANQTQWNGDIEPAALAPIIIVRNQDEVEHLPDGLQFLVTIEWRVRFDPQNPAVASHTHHDTLSDEAWNEIMKVTSVSSHGVEEMAEEVANGGALYAGAAAAYGFGRRMIARYGVEAGAAMLL